MRIQSDQTDIARHVVIEDGHGYLKISVKSEQLRDVESLVIHTSFI